LEIFYVDSRFICLCAILFEATHELNSSKPNSACFARKVWVRRHSVLRVVVVDVVVFALGARPPLNDDPSIWLLIGSKLLSQNLIRQRFI
jgi:hypothetical protein